MKVRARRYLRSASTCVVVALFVAIRAGPALAERYDVYLVPGTSSDQLLPDIPNPGAKHPALDDWSPHTGSASLLTFPNSGDAILGMIKPLLPADADVHVHIIAKGSATDNSSWTGGNSRQARQSASEELADTIKAQPTDGHRIGFAYSHGDTVLENAIGIARMPFDAVFSVASPGVAHASDDLVKTRANFAFDGDAVATHAGESDAIIEGPVPSPGVVRGRNAWNIVLPPAYLDVHGQFVDNSGPAKSHVNAVSPGTLSSQIGPALEYLEKAIPGLKGPANKTHLISLNELLAMQCDDQACRQAVLKALPPDSGVRLCLFEYTKELDEINQTEAEEIADVEAHRERYDWGSGDHKGSELVIKNAKEEAQRSRQSAEERYRRCISGE